jgi:branched-chain amino acid transport system ATP-binding protein
MTALLEGRGLRKEYGGVVAVNDVSLTLARGEILGLVGPNGAGKTTLVDLISGVQGVTAGELMLDGARLDGPPSRRAALGLARTFQHPQLAHEQSVRNNMLVGLVAPRHRSVLGVVGEAARGMFGRPRPGDMAVIESIAAELNLDRLDRLAGDLTLGEQRLVEVGRALAHDPKVLLLDEPFAGADAEGVSGINDVIRIVQGRGHGVILVDHNVDLVAALVDRMMLLHLGETAFDGDPRECLTSPEMKRIFFGEGVDDA